LDTGTYKEAQDDHDDESEVSEENTLTMKRLRETFSKMNEAVGYFVTMILSVIILPRLNVNWKMCCHAADKFYSKKCELRPTSL
jgi:hypothetical protein